MRVFPVSFEVWNISRYLFVTGKRREIAGASELITYLDRRWVREALRELCPGFSDAWRIEEQSAELLSTGAGTARVLVRDDELARRLVTQVTRSALRQAPGLDVCGAVGEAFEWADDRALHHALEMAHATLAQVRMTRPSADSRFLRLPVVDECASTGLPAERMVEQPDQGFEPRSAESRAKWLAYGQTGEGEGLRRLAELAGTKPRRLGRVVNHLNDHAEWVGVVYVDGNGLGRVFQNFAACVPDAGNRAYADTLRSFTERLQNCAEHAFTQAVEELAALGATVREKEQKEHGKEHQKGKEAAGRPDEPLPPVLPLVLGGDDVIAVCEGKWALSFTRAFLTAYERLTGADEVVSGALRNRGLPGNLSASAGVAIVKAHFPFAAGSDLSYALLCEAKQVKEHVPQMPCSGLAFHVLYDSSGADLKRIRATPEKDGPSLAAQPYVVSDVPEGIDWTRGRMWSDLEERVAAVLAQGEEGERALPASQLHDLREGVFLGPEVADARLANMMRRFGDRGLGKLTGGTDSLFWREPSGQESAPGRLVTGFVDALDASPFLPVMPVMPERSGT